MPGEMNAAQWQKPMSERAQTMPKRSTRHIPEPGILAQDMRGNTFGFQ
jgi:hypothetical protein